MNEPTYIQLKNELIEYTRQYYSDKGSSISDEEFDLKYYSLVSMEKKQGWKDADSPSNHIGKVIQYDVKIKHHELMYSMDNAFSNDEMFSFFAGYTENGYSLEPKLDGLAIELIYSNGALVSALTRGDGEYGEDILSKALLIDSIPNSINALGVIVVRGECVIMRSSFAKINELRIASGLNPYKTTRNAAAGSFTSNTDEDVVTNEIVFIAYGTTNWQECSLIERMTNVAVLGFKIVPMQMFFNLAELGEALETLWLDKERQFPYDVDGLVIKLNDAQLIKKLGFTAKYPRWAVARKWNDNIVTTVIKDIVSQVGRTGAITPVAIIEPVIIGGVLVERSTLHNFKECKRLGIGIGAKINIIRSGEVIPKILSVIPSDHVVEPFDAPTHCPVCQMELIYFSEEDAILYCVNVECTGILKARIEHFCSRRGMDIENLSEKTIDKLVDNGSIKTLDDIYRLDKDVLLEVDKFADTSASNLLEAIGRSKTPQLERFIYALGIPEIGEKTSKVISQHFGSMEAFLKTDASELVSIKGIADITAKAILSHIDIPEVFTEIQKLLEVIKPIFNKTTISTALQGKVFCITGSMQLDRTALGNFLEKHSASVTGSVSKKTTLLLVGKEPGDSKVNAAVKNKIKCLEIGDNTLQEITEMIELELGVSLQ